MDADTLNFIAINGFENCGRNPCFSARACGEDACFCVRATFPSREHYQLYLALRERYLMWLSLGLLGAATNGDNKWKWQCQQRRLRFLNKRIYIAKMDSKASDSLSFTLIGVKRPTTQTQTEKTSVFTSRSTVSQQEYAPHLSFRQTRKQERGRVEPIEWWWQKQATITHIATPQRLRNTAEK